MEKETYLVTGAAGFIGSAFAKFALDSGHQVIAVDALIESTYSSDLKSYVWQNLKKTYPGCKLIQGDLRDTDFVKNLPKVNYIFNFAAMPGLMLSWKNFELYSSCNFSVVRNLLEYAVKNEVKKFIQASTSSVYGKIAVGDENQELYPSSPYGVTKLAAEKLIQAYNQNFGLTYNILRYFSVYGPGQRPDMAYQIFCNSILRNEKITIFGDGNQTRTNTYIDDAVKLTSQIATSPNCDNEIFNISSGQEIKLIQALQIISDYFGAEPKLEFKPTRPGDQMSTNADLRKLSKFEISTEFMSIHNGLHLQARHLAESENFNP